MRIKAKKIYQAKSSILYMDIKEFLKLEKKAKITFDDWESIKDYIFKLNLKIKELLASRENWKKKYKELKNS